MEFLDWKDGPKEEDFGQRVKIVLASADFSSELTTTVMWLNNNFEIATISCVKLVPYKLDEQVLLDVQPIVPLPEAEEYLVKSRTKRRSERESRRSSKVKAQLKIADKTIEVFTARELILRVVQAVFKEEDGLKRITEHIRASMFKGYEGRLSPKEVKEQITKQRERERGQPPDKFFCKEEELFYDEGENTTFVLSNNWDWNGAETHSQALARKSRNLEFEVHRPEP